MFLAGNLKAKSWKRSLTFMYFPGVFSDDSCYGHGYIRQILACIIFVVNFYNGHETKIENTQLY